MWERLHDHDVVREGRNLKGRFLGAVLHSVGKSRLETAFADSVKTVETRDYETQSQRTAVAS